jgi:hypothetical protein
MTDDPRRELVAQLAHLIDQAADDSAPILPRITTAIAANGYLEALTRQLVGDARDKGHSWEDLAGVFGTSAVNVQHRFGALRRYDDD